ncbi:MAG: glycosyl hydrolase [Ignavibacteriae bacterium]|nr:glycosyl hydrolase [Ignavibacteriota bacterium]
MRKNTLPVLFLLLFSISTVFSQSVYEENKTPYTVSSDRLKGYSQKSDLLKYSLFREIPFRSIGPTIMSGRVVDIEANPDDPTVFYVAYASGGLFKTSNNGITFNPIFDNEASLIIGDIAVDWKNKTIYVGTGENNSSRSSYPGTGIYKSTDDGKNWIHLGLEETHRIGRIVIDPVNPENVYVAALGHLYSSNSERGVYKSTDGGNHFEKVLYVNDVTGAIDIEINPKNPGILYAAMWERERRAWDFRGAGKNSGIFRTTDGGATWEKLTGKGLPDGDGFGRCGLAISSSNPETVYALIDNNSPKSTEVKKDSAKVTKDILRKISKENFLKLEKSLVEEYLSKYGFPKEYNYEYVSEMVKDDKLKPSALVEYLEDGNSKLFETDVKGGEVYRSDDGGSTWKKTHEGYLDGLFYTYGYYFANIRVSPNNPEKVYLLGVPIIRSDDGGKSFSSLNGDNVHADHHGLWINPKKDGHIINGNDGGINISYDDGLNWYKANTPAVGQFYSVNYDLEKTYNVYGGLQDNGVWYGSSKTEINTDWQNSGDYPFKNLMGGDGMQVVIDTRNNDLVYTGYQFGNYYRISKSKKDYKYITPKHKLGERPYRFNWQAPIQLSPFDMDIVYFGSNRLHRSTDKGDNFETVSGDLTNGGKAGNVPYGTLTTISVSQLTKGLIYTGSDDGLVYVTKDDGEKWENISAGLPKELWVSRVTASKFDAPTVYVTLNGCRWDNFESYVYRSDNYGKTWTRIGTNLSPEPVNVIKEDNDNKRILYLGTDAGVYVSIDRGSSFTPMKGTLPNVPVHDLAVHPTAKELIVGTHGRSVYIADLSIIHKFLSVKNTGNLYVFEPENTEHNPEWGNRTFDWNYTLPKDLVIPFYVNDAGTLKIEIITGGGVKLFEEEKTFSAGINFYEYNLTVGEAFTEMYKEYCKNGKKPELKEKDNRKEYLTEGKYTARISGKTGISEKPFEIKKRQHRESQEQQGIPGDGR